MRIISGRFKGKRLTSVKANTVRPTSDRVKESVFGILGDRVIDSDFLGPLRRHGATLGLKH